MQCISQDAWKSLDKEILLQPHRFPPCCQAVLRLDATHPALLDQVNREVEFEDNFYYEQPRQALHDRYYDLEHNVDLSDSNRQYKNETRHFQR
jgi:hypothetical protein